MSDLHERLKEASAHVTPEWSASRNSRLTRGIETRRARQKTMRRVGSMATVGAVLVFALAFGGRVAEAANALTRWLHALVVTAEPPRPSTESASAAPASAPIARGPAPAAVAIAETKTDEPAAPEASANVVAPSDPTVAAPAKPAHVSDAKGASVPGDWRALAREQDYARAYEAMRAEPKPVRDEAEDLLLASDVARLSKHPAEAIAPLQKIVRDHRGDARAPLAAFTLGRVLLEEKRAREAADAFAEARALDPHGAVAEDALAREAEAAAAAGDGARARRVAESYVAAYPNGARVALVRRWGNLDDR